MNGGKRGERFERIIVACDPSPVGSAALEAAAALAASLQAELAGLFVEDVNLLRIAALPFTRELGLASALMRPIETPDIEREFRRHAELMRKALEDAALASSLRWSFHVVRGQPLAAVLSAAAEADLLVVAAAHPTPKSARDGLRARPVAIVFDGSQQSERALELAVALAGRISCPLTLWVAADSEEEFGNLRARARAALAHHNGAATIRRLQKGDLETVAIAVGSETPAALLWHGPLDSGQLAALLAVVRCPLVLLG